MLDKLEEAKIYVKELDMEVVPLSVAKRLIEEASSVDQETVMKAVQDFTNSFANLESTLNELKQEEDNG